MADRDKTLVNILERLGTEMTRQDEMLENLLAHQSELAKAVESAGLHLRGTQIDTERSYEKLMVSISHYRSDMLKLVNEQDHINRNIEELQKVLKTSAFAADVTNQKLIELDDRLSRQEKTAKDHYEHALKQPEVFKNALSDSSRDFSRLHANTEKHLAEFQKETTRQLDSFQHETMRRLLLLDGIVTSLQTLLMRTEPPEKRPLWIVRGYIKLRGFFRNLLSKMPRIRR